MKYTIDELRAKDLPRATFDKTFDWTPDPDASTEKVEQDVQELREALDSYLAQFIQREDGEFKCPGCQTTLAGSTLGMFDSFTYGLTHGEGHCSECGYPARANHHIEDVVDFRMVLAYHPDVLEEQGVDA